jgi:hypothetical protein
MSALVPKDAPMSRLEVSPQARSVSQDKAAAPGLLRL